MDEARDQLIAQAVETIEELSGGAQTSGVLDGLSNAALSNFTVPQLCVLMFLRPAPQRIGRLAERLHTSLSSATNIANRLEQRGLIERVRDKTDRRGVLCRLTASGESRIDTLYEHQRVMMAQGLGRLGIAELGTVVHAFGLIKRMLEPADDEE